MSTPAPDRRPAVRLVMVTSDNNNKVYEMAENGDGTFTARFGRIGARLQERVYPASRWDTTYRAKTRKGYTDITALAAEEAADGFAVADADRRRAGGPAPCRGRRRAARAVPRRPGAVERAAGGRGAGPPRRARRPGRAPRAPGARPRFRPCRALRRAPARPVPDDPARDGQRPRPPARPGPRRPDRLADVLDAEQEALDRMAQRVRLGDAPDAPRRSSTPRRFDLRPVTDEATLARGSARTWAPTRTGSRDRRRGGPSPPPGAVRRARGGVEARRRRGCCGTARGRRTGSRSWRPAWS